MWIVWTIGILIAAVIAWFLLGLITSIVAPPETTGKLLLKKECQKHGVAIELIPEAAFDEIVAGSIKYAKFSAQFGRNLDERNWRSVLVRSLENQAMCVAEVMRGSKDDLYERTRATLVKFGVLR